MWNLVLGMKFLMNILLLHLILTQRTEIRPEILETAKTANTEKWFHNLYPDASCIAVIRILVMLFSDIQ